MQYFTSPNGGALRLADVIDREAELGLIPVELGQSGELSAATSTFRHAHVVFPEGRQSLASASALGTFSNVPESRRRQVQRIDRHSSRTGATNNESRRWNCTVLRHNNLRFSTNALCRR